VADLSYPLGESAREALVGHLTLDAVLAGDVGPVRVTPATLRLQAGFAERGGNRQLAENLRRGAELVGFGDDELLGFYDMLRPGRSTAAELDELADRLEGGGATRCAELVREARHAYVRRGLIS
jgi:propanediol dehydratase small subunit